jgi:uncharacterized SAM-binding protein YcdF (DUF218 family)
MILFKGMIPMKSKKIDGLIIVLGSPNSEQGELYNIAKERCEQAIREVRNHPSYKILLTGGYGLHFNTTARPHAYYLKNYLVSCGINEEKFVEYAESQNTLEDASLSKPIVLKYRPHHVIVITSDYHFERARFVFDHAFSDEDIPIDFSVVQTDKDKCEVDLDVLITHEKEALRKLQISIG